MEQQPPESMPGAQKPGASQSAKPRTNRLFFALWPPDKIQHKLDLAGRQLYAVCGGKRTPREKIHVTLIFLGDVDVRQIGKLKSIAASVHGSLFSLVVDKLGWWRHNRIGWVTARETPDELAELVTNLGKGLKEAGFRFDERPYLPHATVLRKAQCREAVGEMEPFEWEVRNFALVRSALSESGSVYEIVGQWLLTQPPTNENGPP
jgi:2'-5' RNA ligase